MKIIKFVAIVLTSLVLVVIVVARVSKTPELTPAASAQVPLVAEVAAPSIDMSSGAQASAGAAYKQLVGAGGRLKEHRRGRTGLSPDRVLLYAWGDMDVRDHEGIGGYQVSSFVDTLSGYSGNVVRTPLICTMQEDFVVVSVDFGEIQFPQR